VTLPENGRWAVLFSAFAGVLLWIIGAIFYDHIFDMPKVYSNTWYLAVLLFLTWLVSHWSSFIGVLFYSHMRTHLTVLNTLAAPYLVFKRLDAPLRVSYLSGALSLITNCVSFAIGTEMSDSTLFYIITWGAQAMTLVNITNITCIAFTQRMIPQPYVHGELPAPHNLVLPTAEIEAPETGEVLTRGYVIDTRTTRVRAVVRPSAVGREVCAEVSGGSVQPIVVHAAYSTWRQWLSILDFVLQASDVLVFYVIKKVDRGIHLDYDTQLFGGGDPHGLATK
jgi:hypothetical protein